MCLVRNKKDGSEYMYGPTTVRGFISSFDCHVKEKNCKTSIINDIEFEKKKKNEASTEKQFLFFVCVEVLRPCQQLRSCRAGQLPINTVPGQA